MSMSALKFGDDALAVAIEHDDTNVHVTLTDVHTGRSWGPAPLAAIDVYDRMQLRNDRLDTPRVVGVEPCANGVHVTLADDYRNVAVGLYLAVDDGELVVRLPVFEVYEHAPELYGVFAVDILPGLLTIGGDGELLLPIMSGSIVEPAGKPKLEDRFMIYGEQQRWELLPTLPIVAGQDGQGGMVIIATEAPAEMQCRVSTDGDGEGEAGFAIVLREFWPDKVDDRTRELRFSLLGKDDDMVHAAAARVRRHVIDDHGKPTLAQRAEESPEVEYLLSSYIMKLFYGVHRTGLIVNKSVDGSFALVMTFDECGQQLRKLRDAGVDRIYTQNVGWNPRGHDGAYPSRFPIDERFGGEQAFRDLIKLGHDLGYQMNVHDNFTDGYKASPDYDPEYTLQDIYGNELVAGCWGGGISYRQWALDLPYDRMEGSMRRVQDLGLTGMYYCDGMGNPLYRNYHPRHRGSRSDYADGICRIINTGKQVFGACGTECGFLYCAIPADCMVTSGDVWHTTHWRDTWGVKHMIDRFAPVWRIAMSGLIVHEIHGLGWQTAMRSVLMASHPRDEWSTRPGVMPVIDNARIAQIKAMYDITIKQFGHLQTKQMTRWQRLADKVEQTTFDDGTQVTADFGEGVLNVNGEIVERPTAL